jgi:hypothetical protein
MKWKDIKGRERKDQPHIKDAYFFGVSASVCKKHRKIWREGANFPEACKECCEQKH